MKMKTFKIAAFAGMLLSTACTVTIPDNTVSQTKSSDSQAAASDDTSVKTTSDADSAGLVSLDADKILAKYDTDANKSLSSDEMLPLFERILAFVADHSFQDLSKLEDVLLADDDSAVKSDLDADAKAAMTDRLTKLISTFDKNSDKELSSTELSAALSQLVGHRPHEQGPMGPFGGHPHGRGPGFEHQAKPDLSKLFTCLDADGDGNISAAEWQNFDAGVKECKASS